MGRFNSSSGVVVNVENASTLATTEIDQDHQLAGAGLTLQAPQFDTAAINQDHNIGGDNIITLAPILSSAAITQDQALTAPELAVQQPV